VYAIWLVILGLHILAFKDERLMVDLAADIEDLKKKKI
jgi:hypothetical protein